jgi:hypothetical protein
LISNLFSLFCLYEFPVRTLAAIGGSDRGASTCSRNDCRPGSNFANFPVFFPVSREFERRLVRTRLCRPPSDVRPNFPASDICRPIGRLVDQELGLCRRLREGIDRSRRCADQPDARRAASDIGGASYDVTRASAEERVRLGPVRIFQIVSLLSKLTIAENVALGASAHAQ